MSSSLLPIRGLTVIFTLYLPFTHLVDASPSGSAEPDSLIDRFAPGKEV
jgi:hypothetical protein